MDFTKYNVKELIELAFSSSDVNVLERLARCPYMLVRRAVTKNRYVTEKIINALSYDAVQNVSYLATKNPKCTVQKEFPKDLPSCVICGVDERKVDCEHCKVKSSHRF